MIQATESWTYGISILMVMNSKSVDRCINWLAMHYDKDARKVVRLHVHSPVILNANNLNNFSSYIHHHRSPQFLADYQGYSVELRDSEIIIYQYLPVVHLLPEPSEQCTGCQVLHTIQALLHHLHSRIPSILSSFTNLVITGIAQKPLNNFSLIIVTYISI